MEVAVSFFPYDPPVNNDEPEDDDLFAAMHNLDELAALRSHRSDTDVVMPATDTIEQSIATFLDALLAANPMVTKEQLQHQFIGWCNRQFEAATNRPMVEGDLAHGQEQHVARLLSWLD